ncbi:Uncharacterised protein [uncultured archaeon]|nr:Uncharacterised protein [uncultured archaeon]
MASKKELNIVILSGACCIPGMAPLDKQARSVVEKAISETKIAAKVELVPVSTAYFGGMFKEITGKLMSDYNKSGSVGLPAILIDNKVVSYGVPKIGTIKSALLKYGKQI